MTHESTPSTPQPTSLQTNAVVEVLRFLRVARYRKGVMITSLLVCGALGALFYLTAERRYEATASLFIMQPEAATPTMNGSMGMQKDLMPTYQKLLTSEKVLEDALARLEPRDRVDLARLPRHMWARTLARALSVKAVRSTNILEVSYQSVKPEAAAAVVDAVISSYVGFMDQTHQKTAREILEVLTREKAELEEKMNAKDLELWRARRESEVFISGDAAKAVNVVVARVEALNQELVQAQKKRLEVESSLMALEAAIRNGEDLLQYAVTTTESVGREFLMKKLGISNQDAYILAHASQRLLQDQAELNSLLEYYGEEHPKVQQLRERVRVASDFLNNRQDVISHQLRKVQDGELGPMLLQMVRQKYVEACTHEQRLLENFEREKQQAVALNGRMAWIEMLQLDQKRLRSFYDVLLERIKTVDMGTQDGNIRATIVSSPKVPNDPVWPQLKFVALLSVMLGLGTGFVAVYILDTIDDRFRSIEELQVQLGTTVLAMVRRHDPLPGPGAQKLYVHASPNGPEAEAFRTLRTALGFANEESRQIVVSSSEPGDGKTTITCNLAVACAQSGKRTLLIDADLRRPGSTNLFEMRSRGGLSNVLRGGEPVAESLLANVQSVGVEKLDFLPSGPRPGNPAELLSSERMADLLAWAETVYDQILIDAPPTLACSDAAILGRMADGVVLVVRPDKNRRRVVMRAVESFAIVGVRVFGIVANHLTPESGGDYYGYGYGYGYGTDEIDETDDFTYSHGADDYGGAHLGGGSSRRAA